LRAFADWWTAGGAPDRKLRFWADQPAKATSDAQRILHYFEDWLKKLFWNILQTLEVFSFSYLLYFYLTIPLASVFGPVALCSHTS
jgi:ribosome biogenesis protein MAK21